MAGRQHSRNLPAVIPQPAPDPEQTDRWGRYTSFKPEYIEIARVMCEGGATNQELADHFGINRSTIYDWRNNIPEFAEVLKLGKALADDRMERTAYELAVGYTTTVTETIKLRDERGNERIAETTREVVIPPNADMLRWMLKNRRGEIWRDKTENVVLGEIIHLTLDQAKERVRARLENIRQHELGNNSGE